MSGRILIVDRIATNRIMLRATLQGSQYDVTPCTNMTEAEQALRQTDHDFALIDITQDEAAGLALCAAIKADHDLATVGVIALTSAHDGAPRIAALRAGADDVLDRNESGGLMLARIRNLLRARNAATSMIPHGSDDRAYSFAEAGKGFAGAGRVTVVTARPDALPPVLSKVLDRHAGATTVLARGQDLTDASHAPIADLFIIDAAEVQHGGQGASDLLRIISSLRSSAPTHHAATLVMLPDSERDLAALTLDVGASDLVGAQIRADELAFRVRGLIRRKLREDRWRDNLHFQLQEANLDPLTGLFNRRHAQRRLVRMVEAARLSGSPFAMMMLDIDHFKTINDGHGHDAGDRVLAEVAQLLRDNLRAVDLLARIGGEEFLIAMPETPVENAQGAAERLRRVIEDAPFGGGVGATAGPLRVTTSIGVAMGPIETPRDLPAEVTIKDLFKRADTALYAAKRAGRNTVNLDPFAA